MAREIINKKIAEGLMKTEGECRGMHLKNDADFVLKKKGKEGLKNVEEELERLGCPIKYREIRGLEFYPVGLRAISLLAIKKVFNWKDEDIKELGRFATAASFLVRIYMKFFHSIELIVKKAPKMWDDYFTIGELAVPDYDEEKRYALVEIRGFDLHPIYCRTVEGFFENIVKMVIKAKEVRCQEKKCTFLGDKFHQFLIKWQ